MKFCKNCGQTKSLSEFGPSKITKDGLLAKCRVCQSAYLKAYRAKNSEILAEKAQVKYEANREAILEQKKQYREDNIEKLKAKDKAHYEANREAILEQKKQYHEASREELLPKLRAASKRHYAANKEKYAVTDRLRKAKLKLSGISSAKTVAYLKKIKNDPCYFCGNYNDRMVYDHYYPVARGGTSHWFNYVRACWDCNSAKGAKLASEWEVNHEVSRPPVYESNGVSN